MGEFSLSHILVIAVILLVFFGPSRLPHLGKSIGEAIRGFKGGLSGKEDERGVGPSHQIPPAEKSHTAADVSVAHKEEKKS